MTQTIISIILDWKLDTVNARCNKIIRQNNYI